MVHYTVTDEFRSVKRSALKFYKAGGVRGSPEDPALSRDPEMSRAADVAYYDHLGGYVGTKKPFQEFEREQTEWRNRIREAAQRK